MVVLKVPKTRAEEVRRRLISEDLLDTTQQIERDENFVYISAKKTLQGFDVVKKKLKSIKSKPTISVNFDLIGDVGVLESGGKADAEKLRQLYPRLKTIFVKTGTIENEFRVRPLKLLYGKPRTTVHSEHGVKIYVDPSKVYFSPRLAGERLRVAKQVKPFERVLVMFAGAGPYALLIGKTQRTARVSGVELNPDGVEYFVKGVKANKLKNVTPVLGDVNHIVPGIGKFDRIVMPLPAEAHKFLKLALQCLKPHGVIHFYDFGREPNIFADAVAAVKGAEPRAKILYKGKCGETGPRAYRVVIDFTV